MQYSNFVNNTISFNTFLQNLKGNTLSVFHEGLILSWFEFDTDALFLLLRGKAVNLQDTPVFVNKAQKKVDKQTVENKKPGIQSGKGVKDVEPIFKMALEFIDKKAYKEAVQTLSMAIDLAPTRADLLLKRSWVYFEIAKYQK